MCSCKGEHRDTEVRHRRAPAPFGRPGTRPYHGFDPRYTSATFSFRLACPTDFDCAAEEPESLPVHPAPPIDYLARDYGTLRRLLLDRATLTVPQWIERHE